MAQSFSGGCVCGAVRYTATADPIFSANCHCRDCQRTTGAAFTSFFAVPKASVRVDGELSFYDYKAESGSTVSRGFCPRCGSRVMGKSTLLPDAMVIMAGSLDDASWFKPAMNVWTSRAHPWAPLDPALPGFDKNPPM